VSTKRAQHESREVRLYPSVGGQPAQRLRERVAAFDPGVNAPTFHPVELNNFQVGFDSAWEIDVFGRIRNEVKAASANVALWKRTGAMFLRAACEVARAMRISGLQLPARYSEKNIRTQEDTVHLTQTRAAAGLATQLDVSRAVAELETTNAVVRRARSAIAASIHRIKRLLGQEPAALENELETSAPVPWFRRGSGRIAIGPVKRRPDVRRADDEIAGAAANVQSRKGGLFSEVHFVRVSGKASDATP